MLTKMKCAFRCGEAHRVDLVHEHAAGKCDAQTDIVILASCMLIYRIFTELFTATTALPMQDISLQRSSVLMLTAAVSLAHDTKWQWRCSLEQRLQKHAREEVETSGWSASGRSSACSNSIMPGSVRFFSTSSLLHFSNSA